MHYQVFYITFTLYKSTPTLSWCDVCVCVVGRLFSWGSNSAGQLGIGLPLVSNTDSASSGRPADSGGVMSPLVHCIDSLRGVAVAHITAGSQHSTALSVSGALFTWGFNRYASRHVSTYMLGLEPVRFVMWNWQILILAIYDVFARWMLYSAVTLKYWQCVF